MAARAPAVLPAQPRVERVVAVKPAHPTVERAAVVKLHPMVALARVEPMEHPAAARLAAAQEVQAAVAAGLPKILAAVAVLSRATIISMERPLFHLQQSMATMPIRPGVRRGMVVRLEEVHPAVAQLATEQAGRVALSQPGPGREVALVLIAAALARVRVARARPEQVREERVPALRALELAPKVAA